jgi:hypothetical protein
LETKEVSAAETPLKPTVTGLLLTETPQSKVNYSKVNNTPKGGQRKAQSSTKKGEKDSKEVTANGATNDTFKLGM